MGGVATITKDLENEIRRYLFGQLPEADEENLELRLLSEPAFVEEFDTVVDEVTDQYVRNELSESERKGFEGSFLATVQGKQKLRFTTELLERAAAERRPAPVEPSFFDRLRAFWQVQSLRHAATAAAVVIIAGGIFFIWKSSQSGSVDYAKVDLSISTANRGEGARPERVKLESGAPGVVINLAIPEQAKGAKDYRVKLDNGNDPDRDLSISQRNDQTVTVQVPASNLARGNYAIKMFTIAPDGSEQRVRGSYFFDVE